MRLRNRRWKAFRHINTRPATFKLNGFTPNHNKANADRNPVDAACFTYENVIATRPRAIPNRTHSGNRDGNTCCRTLSIRPTIPTSPPRRSTISLVRAATKASILAMPQMRQPLYSSNPGKITEIGPEQDTDIGSDSAFDEVTRHEDQITDGRLSKRQACNE